MIPRTARFVVIGAGVHGLSTAWHLAQRLSADQHNGPSAHRAAQVVVLDKGDIASGASGVACGVIRNNYFQPAMRELMAHSVDLWESDPEAFAYHPVGYLQIAPESMRADVGQIYSEQRAIGYDSVLVDGAGPTTAYINDLFEDWTGTDASVALHEKRGGYANNVQSMKGLADKARAAGAEIFTGVTITGLSRDNESVTAVETSEGSIACEQVVIAAGPWVRDFWNMLDLPTRISMTGPDGTVHTEVPMWTYWALQEGTLGLDPAEFMDNHGNFPPVVHVDSDEPLYDDEDGTLITDQMWGIYYKPDFSYGGVQGGAAPQRLERPADQVAVDPYGTQSPEFVVGKDFIRMWTSALAHCHRRFRGKRRLYLDEPSGGIGAFTPDSFPVFDTFRQNAYVIADSNHGYKMLGIGQLVAEELLGQPQALLQPFRFSRYATGELHPTSHSPFPWS